MRSYTIDIKIFYEAIAFKIVLWTHNIQVWHKQSSSEDPLRIQSFKTHKEMIYHFQESENAKESPQEAYYISKNLR